MGRFSVRTTVGEEMVTVAVSGDCDLACRQELVAALQAAVSKGPVVAVDLTEVQFLDSSGLHCLVVAYQEAVAQGKVLYATGAGGAVAHVLDLTGVGELLAPPAGEAR